MNNIRKFTFGASSILIGSLLFMGVDSAQAAETEKQASEMSYQDIGEHIGENQKMYENRKQKRGNAWKDIIRCNQNPSALHSAVGCILL